MPRLLPTRAKPVDRPRVEIKMGHHDHDIRWWLARRLLGLLPRRHAALRRPIFVVGTVRSGTTLLAKSLGAHPKVCFVGFELTRQWCGLGEIDIATTGNGKPHCPPLSDRDALPERCSRLRRGMAEIFALEGGRDGVRFLNKNPHLWNKLEFVSEVFPDASLLVASRDLRSTVASTKRLWDYASRSRGTRYHLPEDPRYCWTISPPATLDGADASRTFPGGSVAVLAEYWLRVYETIERAARRFETVVPVMHARFVADPRRTLSAICDAVGLPGQRFTLPTGIDRERNQQWRDILTAAERRELDAFIDRQADRIRRLAYADVSL